jgi:hypothetical protein
MRKFLAIAALTGALIVSLAACNSSSGDKAKAQGAAASVTADPQFLAAKALVVHCFAGTPVQQASQIHLVFLSSSTGKNGPAVIAARAKLSGCFGISKSDEQPFFNDAVKAAEHQKPRLHVLHPVAWLTAFFGQTLPPVVIKYSNAPGLGTASPSAKASS